MKKKPTSVRMQIPEPCSQPFEHMHPLPGGRHCEKCEKTVVDFTNMSDGEMVRIFQKKQGRVCGVFHNDQLERKMPLPLTFDKSSNWKAMAAFASALLFGNMAAGQSAEDISKMPKEEMFMRGINPSTTSGFQMIHGKVTDENGEPLIGANVLTGPGEGTATDVDGLFVLKIPASVFSQKITVTYLGFEDQEVVWEKDGFNEDQLGVKLSVSSTSLIEVVVTAEGRRSGCILTGGGVMIREFTNEESKEEITPTEYIPILEVFPNPFVSHINVKIELEKPEATLFHLYGEVGQLLFAETHELATGTQYVRLDLNKNNLPEGIYFLRISDSIGEIKTKKIIKVRP